MQGPLPFCLCAQSMQNKTGEDVAYSFRAPFDSPFSVARLFRPRALADVLHDHLTARSAQVATAGVIVKSVTMFISAVIYISVPRHRSAWPTGAGG